MAKKTCVKIKPVVPGTETHNFRLRENIKDVFKEHSHLNKYLGKEEFILFDKIEKGLMGSFGNLRRANVVQKAKPPTLVSFNDRQFCHFSGDSGAIRTPDPQLRRLLLYPAELRNLLPKYRISGCKDTKKI